MEVTRKSDNTCWVPQLKLPLLEACPERSRMGGVVGAVR